MWIFIWCVLSLFIFSVMLWSIRILLRQKSVWKSFGEKMKLTYHAGPRFLDSPSLSGTIGAYGFGLYTEAQRTNDARGQRFNTVMEIGLRRGLPETGAMGTGEVMRFTEILKLDQVVVPQDPDWDKEWTVRTRSAAMIEHYLTPARMEVLKKIFRMKTQSTLFVFDQNDAVLRIVTTDPLTDKNRLEKIVKNLVSQIDVLVVKRDEFRILQEIVNSGYRPEDAEPETAKIPAEPESAAPDPAPSTGEESTPEG